MKKLTMQAMQELAESRGGKCLSDGYVDTHSKLLWECAIGHQWMASPANIRKGGWCPICRIAASKSTIEDMRRLAKTRGGRCLSDTYVNSQSSLTWQCAQGHQWTARPSNVTHGSWCPVCYGNVKLTIRDMQRLAETRGGKCLSDIYVGANSKLTWQCDKGHRWTATPASIRHGTWCPECGHISGAQKQLSSIGEIRKLAQSRGGICLSDSYVNSRSKLLWQCSEGHQWTAVPTNIQRGEWCPKCSGRARLTIQEMRALAESRGGNCLSETCITGAEPLLWQCAGGHQWKAVPYSVKSGSWCPLCAGQGKKSMEEVRHLAQRRGGKCLSQDYVNARTPMDWQCSDGHQWKATWENINQGQWCPQCTTWLGERICREFFSQLLGHSFQKARPKWLINKFGNQMELDGYCATLGIAFEHQGEQHYSTKAHFARSESALARRQEDDALKSNLCAQRGITLIAVPQIPKRLPLDEVRTFIKEQLAANGIALPQGFDTREVDTSRAYRTSVSREILNDLRSIAAEHGGQCLSTSYVDDGTNLLWQCANGHKWEATPSNTKRGHWCPYCAGRGKTIRDMQQLAAQKGGWCLSPTYLGIKTRLTWQCAEGHQWKAAPNNIVQGQWCPVCGRRRGWEGRRARQAATSLSRDKRHHRES